MVYALYAQSDSRVQSLIIKPHVCSILPLFSCLRQQFFLVGSESELFSFLRGQHTRCNLYTMEEIDEILESLPRDEGARRRVFERTANDSTEELDDNQVAWNEQETGSSEDEALTKRAKHQGVTAALGGPSNSETQSVVSRGARSALGSPLKLPRRNTIQGISCGRIRQRGVYGSNRNPRPVGKSLRDALLEGADSSAGQPPQLSGRWVQL